MTPDERVRRLASRGAALASTRRVRLVAQLLVAGAFVFVLLRLDSVWSDSNIKWGDVRWPPLVLGVVAVALAVGLAAFVWVGILRRLGIATEARWAGIYLQAQVAKYIPGSVWQYAGRVALARSEGIPVKVVTLSVTIELAGAILGAAVLTVLAFGAWGYAAAGIILLALPFAWRAMQWHAARRTDTGLGGRRLEGTVGGALAVACVAYLVVTILLGGALWLFAASLLEPAARDIPFYVGAFSIAWLAGLVAIFAPGGLGVREAVLVALLRGRIGTADAVLLAATARVAMTLVDLLMAGAGVVVLHRRR
jgi:glycosyltransferase 2 family protein